MGTLAPRSKLSGVVSNGLELGLGDGWQRSLPVGIERFRSGKILSTYTNRVFGDQ
jgi:hypothetical protein